MNDSTIKSLVLGVAMAVSLPLYAQAPAESVAPVARVETDSGVVMISDSGEFATAMANQSVPAKARIMVSEGSSATVVYKDGCKQKYDKPGVYEVSATCVPAAAFASSGGPSAALIVGGAVLASAAVYTIVDNNSSNDDRPPVSR